MQHVWLNKAFSSVAAVISLVREADVVGDCHIVYSNTNPYILDFLFAHESAIEYSELKGEAYWDWCFHFCRRVFNGLQIQLIRADICVAERACAMEL